MSHRVQEKIVELKNELRALKSSFSMNAKALNFAPVASTSYSGTYPTNGETLVFPKVRATFTRTDGINEMPFVDLAVSASLSPLYTEYLDQHFGNNTVGPDKRFAETSNVFVYINSVEGGRVAFDIDVSYGYWVAQAPEITVSFTLNIQAIAPVPGTLTVERIE